MEDNKKERIKYAKMINEVNNKIMACGSWDVEKLKLLEIEKAELEWKRLSTFKDIEDFNVHKEKLEKTKKVRWSGCYTPYLGYGGGNVASPVADIYSPALEREWVMKVQTERLEAVEKALNSGNLEEYLRLRREELG